ncbi:MAG: type IV secretion system DNA-binding domain-containing protein [Gammaproteobacteria bacterium]|nr:type IV secretion system DNA-binding domain-containing protein [Gammaproteobacteria bacterium]
MNTLPALLGMGWIGMIVTLFVALSVIMTVPFVRKILWKGLMVFPAAALFVIGALAVPFWHPLTWGIARVPYASRVGALFAAGVERLGIRSSNPLNRGEREAVARELWPEKRYPFLYEDVPPDIVRPLWEDGKLVGGRDIPWLADRHFTAAMQEKAGQLGLTAALLTFLLPLIVIGILNLTLTPGTPETDAAKVLLEQFPHEEPVYVSGWSVWTAVIGDAFGSALHALVNSVGFVLAWALVSVGAGLLIAITAIEYWRREQAAPYELISKDAHVRWPYRAEARALAHNSYVRQMRHATGYLKDSPLFTIGAGTGTMRVRGDLAAPSPGQALALDRESLFQHLMVFGGTGDGKTTAVLKPLLRQVLEQRQFGAYVTDAKGVLWRDAERIAGEVGRSGDLIWIGTGPNEKGVNICEKLTPNQIAATLRSVLHQTGGSSRESFWPDMASNVMRHMLTLGRAYAQTPQGKAESAVVHPYSLWWAYQAVLDPDKMKSALDALADEIRQLMDETNQALAKGDREAYDALEEKRQNLSGPAIIASQEYLSGAWSQMAKDTRTGIIANVSQLMDNFAGAPMLRERFASGLASNTVSLDAPLNGKVVLVTLSTLEEGIAARLVAVLLKTTLYREARLREAALKGKDGPTPQDRPCLVMMDEVQEIVTVDPSSGLSDATFWNVARSTGLAGVFATQTVAALKQAMGKDAADNFLQQTRSKVFLRSEDQATVSYACWCAGEFERNRVFDDGQWESLDQRRLVSGWTPLDPIDETASKLDAGPTFFFKAAKGLFSGPAVGQASARRTYEADQRFIPDKVGVAQLSAQQQAAWRAEDQERRYRTEGNSLAPAMTISDVIAMGRWHAFAHIQRAGVARQDIIELKHEY